MRLPKGYSYDEKKQLFCYRFTFESKRHSVYGHTVKECERKADELKNLLKDHMHIENQKITLETFYSGWIMEQAQTVKPSTLYAYEKSWKHLERYLGKLRVVKIQKSDIQSFQKRMIASGKTANTVNNAVRLLKQLLNAAVNDRIINFNPAGAVKRLKTEKPKATETNHRALTIEETAAFLDAAKECYYFNLFRFLLNSGCRIGEALALTWKDVDYKRKEIGINKTVSRTSSKGCEVLDSPKTASGNRCVPLTDNIIAILKAQEAQNKLLCTLSIENRVFPNTSGKTSNYNAVNICIANIIRNINEAAQAEKVKPFSVHAFRDTFATRCIEQGMQPHTLKALLGHSSLKMTMDLYAHVMPNTKHEELSKIRLAI